MHAQFCASTSRCPIKLKMPNKDTQNTIQRKQKYELKWSISQRDGNSFAVQNDPNNNRESSKSLNLNQI